MSGERKRQRKQGEKIRREKERQEGERKRGTARKSVSEGGRTTEQ